MLRTPLVNVMTAAAQKAARGLVRDFGEVEHLQVSKKGPSDFVSTADKKAETVLFEELQRARPKYGFLMEERGVVEGPDSSNRWIIDPLDGTTNFLHGIPQFSISIALERDGQIFAGVIYNPVTDEMFAAEKGQGAFLNGRRLRVSARRDLAQSLFATGIPFLGRENHELFLSQLQAVMAVSAGVRRFGAASLDLAWVAAGRYEGFWEQNLQPWDIAAGMILVAEAGGFVSDLAGGRNMLDRGDIAAGNDAMHQVLLKTLAGASKGS
jgi:myo-inositol-1(or 4)-monophosphatase